MIVLIYLPVIFICLFILYAIARHDFVLLRQNINLRKIFDCAFTIIIVSFIFSRIGYIIYFGKFELMSPLKFLYLSKYWGVVPFIGFISMCFLIILLFRKKKNTLRILDIFSLSFSPLILLDIFLQGNSGINIYLKVVSVIVLSLFYFWFVKINNKFTLKDGFITTLIYITYSLVILAFNFSDVGFLNLKYIWFQLILIISLLCFSVMLFFVQKEKFVR